MKKTMKLNLSALVLLALLTGCGRDTTADEHDAEKNRSDQAQTEAVQGTYTGVLISSADGKPMSPLTLELSADTRIQSGKQTSVVSAQVTLSDGSADSEITLHLADGPYDLVNGNFRIESVVEDGRSGTTIALVGTVVGNQIVGRLEAKSYAAYGGTFTLTKDAELPKGSPQVRSLDRGRNLSGSQFRGTARNDLGDSLAVRMIYLPTNRNLDQKFLDQIYPIHSGKVTIYLGQYDPRPVNFPRIDRDLRGRVMSGISGDGTISLNCTEALTKKSIGWNCIWTGTREIKFTAFLLTR